MLCQSCQARLPIGKVLCPECGHLNPYNIKGFGNTKAVQTAMKAMIDEHCGSIADTRQFEAAMLDSIPEYDTEFSLLKKAVDARAFDIIINTARKKDAFDALRDVLIQSSGFDKGEAEFVLACFGHMLGLPYVSALYEDDKLPKDEEKEKDDDMPFPVRPKTFGKFDAWKYALSGRISVKEGFTALDAYVFENYGILKEINLPSTLNIIGEYAFSDCKSLEGIRIPEGVRKLDKGVFNACVGLKRVKLPESLTSIGDNCFFCCTSLKALRIPDNVSSIGENAFSGCAALEQLAIPRNVKFIDNNAFAYCGRLTVICTENSFVHKYCMQNGIKYSTLPLGAALPGGDEVEDELDE